MIVWKIQLHSGISSGGMKEGQFQCQQQSVCLSRTGAIHALCWKDRNVNAKAKGASPCLHSFFKLNLE